MAKCQTLAKGTIMKTGKKAGRLFPASLTVTLVVLLFSSWSIGTVLIERITENPRRYVGSTVRISGTITNVRTVPFTEIRVLTVSDGSGRILVLATGDYRTESRFRSRVVIRGVQTGTAEHFAIDSVDRLAEFLVERGLVEPRNAEGFAHRTNNLLTTLMSAMDISLWASASD